MKFDFGDTVACRTTNDEGIPVEKVCEVVAITPIENDEQAKHYGYPIGTVVYTVEFGDGTDANAPEHDLHTQEDSERKIAM